MEGKYRQVKLVKKEKDYLYEIITFIEESFAIQGNTVEFIDKQNIYPGIWTVSEIYDLLISEQLIHIRNVRHEISRTLDISK